MEFTPFLDCLAKYITLTKEEEALLLSKVRFRKYRKGQYVLQEGDICQYDSFVLSGCLRTFYTDHAGNEHTIMFSIENWWAGDMGSFLTQTPAHYSVQCLEDTELIQISYHSLEQLYLEIPKLERFFRIITQKAYVACEKRIIKNFSLPAKERYLTFRKKYPHIEQRVPQYMIASYLGITKEFLSKIRNQKPAPERRAAQLA